MSHRNGSKPTSVFQVAQSMVRSVHQPQSHRMNLLPIIQTRHSQSHRVDKLKENFFALMQKYF